MTPPLAGGSARRPPRSRCADGEPACCLAGRTRWPPARMATGSPDGYTVPLIDHMPMVADIGRSGPTGP